MAQLDTSKTYNTEQVQRDQQLHKVRVEATRRIALRWNEVGQRNAALGLYTQAECDACKLWISDHRQAAKDLEARTDLLEIDVTDDQYWPPL